MSDDPDPKTPTTPGFGDLESPFLFVPHGAPEPTEWMRKHPGWVKFPATSGGEGYTGPIADPEKAMRGYMAFMAEGGGLGKVDADPDAPVKAYLSAMEVWKNPAKYAGYPRPGALPVSARAPSQAERNSGTPTRFGRAWTGRAAGTSGGTQMAQMALPLPTPPPTGRMEDTVPSAGGPGVAEEVARAGRRLGHVGGQIGRGDLAGAAGHLLLVRPLPEAVDDPALAAMRAVPLPRPAARSNPGEAWRADVVLNQNASEDGQPTGGVRSKDLDNLIEQKEADTNARLEDALNEEHLSGAEGELNERNIKNPYTGEDRINPRTGKVFNHVEEVRSAQRGLGNDIRDLENKVHHSQRYVHPRPKASINDANELLKRMRAICNYPPPLAFGA